jgi:ADP-ribose pyrophosphatase YjhB (NUDIX family)
LLRLALGGDAQMAADGTHELWVTLGGRIEPGESVLAAAERELREETGTIDARVGPVVWCGEQVLLIDGQLTRLKESFVLARSATSSVTETGWTAEERRVIAEMRWWSLEDLATTSSTIKPPGLNNLLRELLESPTPMTSERFAPSNCSSGVVRYIRLRVFAQKGPARPVPWIACAQLCGRALAGERPPLAYDRLGKHRAHRLAFREAPGVAVGESGAGLAFGAPAGDGCAKEQRERDRKRDSADGPHQHCHHRRHHERQQRINARRDGTPEVGVARERFRSVRGPGSHP